MKVGKLRPLTTHPCPPGGCIKSDLVIIAIPRHRPRTVPPPLSLRLNHTIENAGGYRQRFWGKFRDN